MPPLTGLLLGLPVLRVRHDYIAIVTLGFGEIVKLILNNWTDLTDGPNGIYGMAPPQVFGWAIKSRVGYYYLVLVLVCLVVFFMYRLGNSRLGRAWIAIREDEISASSLGIKTNRLKLLAFTLGAGLAGMAGCVLAAKHRFISPAGFGFYESIILLCMVTIGGIGNIPGRHAGGRHSLLGPGDPSGVQRFSDDHRRLGHDRPDAFPARGDPRQGKAQNHLDSSGQDPERPVCPLIFFEPMRERFLIGKNISKVFGGVRALQEVSLEILRGEILGLIGPNGAGKTTLFNCMTGIYPPTGGQIILEGRQLDLGGLKPPEVARLGVARTFQNSRVFSGMTTLENVMAGCHLWTRAGLGGAIFAGRGTRKEETEIVDYSLELLEFFGPRAPGQYPGKFSALWFAAASGNCPGHGHPSAAPVAGRTHLRHESP